MATLGLCCLSSTKSIAFKRVAAGKKTFDAMTESEQIAKMHKVYSLNVAMLDSAITQCLGWGFKLYRMSSEMFQFSDTPIGKRILLEYKKELARIGDRATAAGIRLVAHPDQNCSLSAPEEITIENSIKMLEAHADLFDYMGLQESRYNLLNIHGSGKPTAERVAKLIETINALPHRIKSRLTLENCEYCWSVGDLYEIYKATGVSIMYDVHHDLVMLYRELFPKLKKNASYSPLQVALQAELLEKRYNHPLLESSFRLARSTWADVSLQMCHVSNGKDGFGDRRHSDYISEFPEFFKQDDLAVEVEAKMKELAVQGLLATF